MLSVKNVHNKTCTDTSYTLHVPTILPIYIQPNKNKFQNDKLQNFIIFVSNMDRRLTYCYLSLNFDKLHKPKKP